MCALVGWLVELGWGALSYMGPRLLGLGHILTVFSCTNAVISLASLPPLLVPCSPAMVLPICRSLSSLLEERVPWPSPPHCLEAPQDKIPTLSQNKQSSCDLPAQSDPTAVAPETTRSPLRPPQPAPCSLWFLRHL